MRKRMWQHGPEMLQHCLHREEALTPDSWMLGLKYDLHWLYELDPLGVPPLAPMCHAKDPAAL